MLFPVVLKIEFWVRLLRVGIVFVLFFRVPWPVFSLTFLSNCLDFFPLHWPLFLLSLDLFLYPWALLWITSYLFSFIIPSITTLLVTTLLSLNLFFLRLFYFLWLIHLLVLLLIFALIAFTTNTSENLLLEFSVPSFYKRVYTSIESILFGN